MTTKNLLKMALKTTEPVIKEYVRQLKTEIAKFDKQIAKIEIEKMKFKNQNVTYKQRISALQKTLDKTKSEGGNIIFQVTSHKTSPPKNEE